MLRGEIPFCKSMLTSGSSSHCHSPSAVEAQPKTQCSWMSQVPSRGLSGSSPIRDAALGSLAICCESDSQGTHSFGSIEFSMAGWSLRMFPAWNAAVVWAFCKRYLEDELIGREKFKLDKHFGSSWKCLKILEMRKKLVHHFALRDWRQHPQLVWPRRDGKISLMKHKQSNTSQRLPSHRQRADWSLQVQNMGNYLDISKAKFGLSLQCLLQTVTR